MSVEQAVRLVKRAVQLHPKSNHVAELISNAMAILRGEDDYQKHIFSVARFLYTSGLTDHAIECAREIVQGTPEDDHCFEYRQDLFCSMLGERYDRDARTEDFDEGVRAGEKAVSSSNYDPCYCNNLSLILGSGAKRNDDINHLDRAINIASKGVKKALSDDTISNDDRAKFMKTLADLLTERYTRNYVLNDIEKAIELLRSAIRFLPDMNGLWYSLAVSLDAMFRSSGELQHLQESIKCCERARRLTDHESPNYNKILSIMCTLLTSRFSKNRDPSDIDNAIKNGLSVVENTSDDYIDLAERLSNLGAAFHAKFLDKGSTTDLDKAILYGRRAVNSNLTATPTDRANYLNNLARRLCSKFSITGKREFIDEAIDFGHQALRTSPTGYKGLLYAGNLSEMYTARFENLKASEDIKEAIRIAREVIYFTPIGHSDLAHHMDKLANIYYCNFTMSKHVNDLNEAILIKRMAIEVTTPDDNFSKAIRLHNLAVVMYSKLTIETGLTADDIDRTIDIEKRVLSIIERLSGPDYYSKVSIVHTLCLLYELRYKETGIKDDLNVAYNYAREAVEKTAYKDSNLACRSCSLARLLEFLSKVEIEQSDMLRKGAISQYVVALRQENGYPLVRLEAGRIAGMLYCEDQDWAQASVVFKIAVELIPRISPRSLMRDDQQHALEGLSGLSAFAASTTLLAEHDASKALALLEAGRGVITGIAVNLRSDLLCLKEGSPDLYYEYTKLINDLSSYSLALDNIPHPSMTLSSVDVVSDRIRCINRMSEIEDIIRQSVQGLRRFQLTPDSEFIKEQAEICPIVSFNVTESCSDAFIVSRYEIIALPLPNLTLDDLKKRLEQIMRWNNKGYTANWNKRNNELRDTLKWLWNVAVYPVMKRLNKMDLPSFKASKESGRLPRLLWVTSGLMGLMPLHAAGHKWGIKSRMNTASRVVSSYTTTFKALAHARIISRKRTILSDKDLLFISMPQTPGGWSDISAELEETGIKESIESFKSIRSPSKADVITNLKTAHIAHFCCHGQSDRKDPSNGGLLFMGDMDGTADCLTVRELAEASFDRAQLAYLSACSTAENFSQNLIDEVIHIAGAFQLVGFPHVIGTLWQADNEVATEVAKIFYKELIRYRNIFSSDYEDGDAIAYALHDAIATIRNNQESCMDDVIDWAPFIHLGC